MYTKIVLSGKGWQAWRFNHFPVILVLLILTGLFPVGTASGQSGPGGVGNPVGSGGQPMNKLWLKADAGITTALRTETSVTVVAGFGSVLRNSGTTSLIALFPVGSTINIGGTSATVTGGNATNLSINPLIIQGSAVNPSHVAVSVWADQANSNNATQPTSANQPVLVINALNGNPVVRFDGLNREMLFGATLDNSSALPLTFFAVTANTSNPKALFDSRPAQGDVFRFFNDGSGPGANNSVEYWNNNPSVGSVTLSNAGSVLSVSGSLSGGLQRQLSVFVGGTQVGTTATGTTAAVGFSSARLGSINGSNPVPDAFFTGDMAEVVYYNGTLNAAQRIIVENYLGAKYGIALTTNDRYASTAFNDNVIGIGTTDGTVKHLNSGGGALYLTESGSSLNASNEYLFGGHNNTAHGAATTLLSGGVDSRWTREYRVEKTGGVDAILGFNYSDAGLSMPTNNAAEYVLLYHLNTGTNFSVVTATPSISGSQVNFTVANANLATGYYTLGVRYLPATLYTYNTNCNGSACDWGNPGSWTTDNTGATSVGGRSPQSGDNVFILNGATVNVTTSGISANNVTVNSGGTMDLGSTTGHNFTSLNNTSPSGAGTLRISANAGGTPVFPTIGTNNFFTATGNTIEYDGATSYNLPNSPGTYQNLIISGGGTKTAAGSITVNKNFTNQASTTFTTGSNLTFKGNFTNEGTCRQTNNTTTFSGNTAQNLTGTSPVSTVFNELSINNSSAVTVGSTIDFTVNGDFSQDNAAAFNATAGTVTLGRTNDQRIGGNGSGTVNFYNLTAGGDDTKTIERNFSVSNTLSVINGVTLEYPNGTSRTVSAKNVIVNGTFDLENGGPSTTHSLSISGNLAVSGTFDMDNGSRVCNVTFNGANSAISGGGSIVFKHVTFNAGLTATSTSNMTIIGNFTNNGTLTASAGRTTFDSGNSQSIGGSGTTTLFNLTADDTNITLSQNITVAGTANGTNADGSSAALGIGDDASLSAGSNSITFTGTGGSFVSNNTNFSAGTGTVVFAGSTTISNPTTFRNIQINSASSATTASSLTIGGNLVNNNGAFTQTANTTTFNGLNQSIGGTGLPNTVFNHLTTSGGGTKTLTGNAVVNGNLNLTSGVIALSNHTLQLGATSLVVGNAPGASNMVQGSGTGALRKLFNTTGSFVFPVGSGSVYTPATVNVTAATFGGAAGSRYVEANPVATAAPNQLDPAYSLAKHWEINTANMTGITATLSFSYADSEANTTIEPQYVPGHWNGSAWNTAGTVNTGSNQISFTRAGVANLNGHWTAGPLLAFTAGNFYSIANGNYENRLTWSLTGYGGAAAPFPPLNGSNVFVGNNKTVTVTAGGKSIGTLQVDGGATPGTLDVGMFTGIAVTTFNTTTIAGTAGTLRLSAAAGGTAVFPAVSGTNNFVNTGGSNVEYTGATNYTLPFSPNAYQNLVFSGGGTKSLSGDVAVTGNLTLTSGIIVLGNYNLQLGATSTVAGAPGSTSMVQASGTGVLRKLFNATGSFTFPVGTGGVYTPVTIDITTATFGGPANSRYVEVKPVAGAPAAQLDAIYSLNKHWIISTTNITGFTGNLSFVYDITERNSLGEPYYTTAYSLVSPATISPATSWVTGTGAVTVASRTISHVGFTSPGGLTNSLWTALPRQAVIPTNFYSIANGAYEAATTWSTTNYAGTAAPLPPTNGSSIYIGNGKTVTMTSGSKAIAALQIDGGATPGTLDIGTYTGIAIATFNTTSAAGTAGTLRLSAPTAGTPIFPTVSGTNNFLITSGSTVEFNNTTTYSLPITPATYQNLTLSGTSIKTLAGNMTINENLSLVSGMLSFGNTARTVGVTGNLSGAGSIIMTGSANHVLNLSGASNSLGSLITDTNNSTVNYHRSDGTAQQVFASANYRNLAILGSGNKTLQGHATVNNDLVVSGGTLAFGVTGRALQVNGNLSGAGTLDLSGAAHTLTLMGAGNDIGSLISDSNASTVAYGGTSQQVFDSPHYHSLAISGSGVKTLTGGAVTVNGDLTLSAGTLEVNSQHFTVVGTSSITGTLSDNHNGGTNTFGKVTVNVSGSVSTGNDSPFVFKGGITNHDTFSKTGNGSVTFNTNDQVIDGSTPIILAGTGVVSVSGVTVDNRHAGLAVNNLTVSPNAKWKNSYATFPATYTGFSSASPLLGQFNSLSASNNAGTSVASPTGNNLILNRTTGGSAYAVKTTGFGTAAAAMVVRFDLNTTSAGTANNAATLLIGNGLTDDATVNAATARLQVNLGSSGTNYTITHPDGTAATSAVHNNTQTVTWVINTSGSTVNYTNPDQKNANALANGRADVWVGNTRFAAGLAVQTAAQAMNSFKVIMTGGSGTVALGNIQINPLGTVNTSALASAYCITAFVGTTFDVPFTAAGAMTANTHFNTANVYTAQLSDASGSFANPLNIGTLTTSALSGTVSATIPAYTASGTGYRIRVVSSEPISIAADNGSNLSISLNAIIPYASQSVTTTSTGTMLTASASGVTSYQWGYYTVLGGPITDLAGKTSATYTPNGPDFPGAGTYSLVCRMTTSTSCGTVASNEVVLYINCPMQTNLVTNGDFSAGNTGFTNSYAYVADNANPDVRNEMYPEGTYHVGSNPYEIHNLFCNMSTPALRSPGSGGNMLIGNAATSGSFPVWKQTVSVAKNTDYVLTFWASSLAGSESSLLFGIYVGCFRVGSDVSVPFQTVNCSWNKYSFQLNSGNATSLNLAINNISAEASGNDIAVDDIQFYACDQVSSPPFEVADSYTWRGVTADWFNIDNWGTSCALPGCNDDIIIPLLGAGKVYPVINGNGATAGSVTIRNGARMTINPGYNLNVCGDFINDGTVVNRNNSTVTFIGGKNPQLVSGNLTGSNKFVNLVVNKTSATDVLQFSNPADIGGNLTNTKGNVDANGKSIKIGGNLTNSDSFTHNNATVEFNGTGNQQFTQSGTGQFYNLIVNNSSATNTLTFNAPVTTVTNQLTLTRGIVVTTGSNEITVTNDAATAVSGHSAGSYVNGRLRRAVSGTQTYDFPVGTSTRYELMRMQVTANLGAGVTSMTGYFTNGNPTAGTGLPAIDGGSTYYSMCAGGFWDLSPNIAADAGARYNLTLFPVGFSCAGLDQTFIKRHDASSAWTLDGSTYVDATTRNGLSSFSEIVPASGVVPLPVRLLGFEGKIKSEQVQLDWQTASEKDNAYFEIQRSSDGRTFETMGKVSGAGTTNERRIYRFLDKDPLPGLSYYRLKQFDFDSRFEYSKTIAIDNMQTGDVIQLLPNPAGKDVDVHLKIASTDDKDYTVVIRDLQGKELSQETKKLLKGTNDWIIIQRLSLSTGMYVIQVMPANRTKEKTIRYFKLIVQ